jgi:N-acetylneuraminic acid mutarotase
MRRRRSTLTVLLALATVIFSLSAPGGASAAPARHVRAAPPTLAGTWRSLPPVQWPAGTMETVSAWTGSQMVVFGRAQPHPPSSVDVAAAYSPTTRTWRRLSPLTGPSGNFQGHYSAFWTGTEVLIFGPFDFQAYNPSTNHWRRLPAPPTAAGPSGLVVWTGREMIYWGGGCCEDFLSTGAAFNPTTNTWRALASSPLAPSQTPAGAWTGRELMILVTGLGPEAKPFPARLARAAAYNPTTNTWRRIAPLPSARFGAVAVWDGRELLVAGGTTSSGGTPPSLAPTGYAYDPATRRWRALAAMPSGRSFALGLWTGKRLLMWGGLTTLTGQASSPARGLSFDPTANRWAVLAQAPPGARSSPTAVWTGHALIVWGAVSATRRHNLAGGASFTPATR